MSEELTDEELADILNRHRGERDIHVLFATIDTLTTQLAEMTMERGLERAGRSGSRLRATAYEEMYREAIDRALAAEATVDRYKGAIAVLWRIAQYDPRWVGMHVNDAPGRSKIIALAYDAHHALSIELGEGTDVPPPSH